MAAPIDGNGFSQKYAAILQTITVVALFVGAVWVAVLSPIQTRQDRIEKEILTHIQQQRYNNDQTRLAVVLDDFERREVQVERAIARLDEAIKNAELRLEVQSRNLASTRAEMVARPEHVVKWEGDKQHFERMQSDIKDIRDLLGGSYSIKDAIAKQQRDIDDIRSRIFTPVK